MEGVSVNPEGERRHGQVRAKIKRKEKAKQTKIEEMVDGQTPSEEGAEIQNPKKEGESGRIRRTPGLCESIIEPEPGWSRRASGRPDCGTGQSFFEVRGDLVLSLYWPETCCGSGLQWLVAERARAWFQ